MKNGEIKSGLISAALFKINYETNILIITRDISKIKKLQNEIIEKEQKFRNLIESAGDAIFLADFETEKILLTNKQACVSLGYTKNELLKKKVPELDPVFIKQQHRTKIWKNIDLNKMITIEAIHQRKNGSQFPVEVRIGVILFKGKKAVLGFARDITNRKKTEKQLEEYRNKLEDMVKERTDELETTLEELKTLNDELYIKNRDLEKYNQLFIDREFRIKELREKVKELEGK